MNSQPVLVGAFEAKTKLGHLLERVGQGASFVMTKHDRPVARLVGYDEGKVARRAEVVARMRALRARYQLGGLDLRIVDPETTIRAWGKTFDLAQQHALFTYNAADLELAMRRGLPVATLDRELSAACRATGVRLKLS